MLNEYSRKMLGMTPLVSMSDSLLNGTPKSSFWCFAAIRKLAASTSRMVNPNCSRSARSFCPAVVNSMPPIVVLRTKAGTLTKYRKSKNIYNLRSRAYGIRNSEVALPEWIEHPSAKREESSRKPESTARSTRKLAVNEAGRDHGRGDVLWITSERDIYG